MKEEQDCPPKQQTEGAPQQKHKWTQQDITAVQPFFPKHTFPIKKKETLLPVEMYELFFDDETSHIVLSAIWDYAMFDLTQS
jgi:hypothetical protein